jgi:hypothetical protein
MKAEVFRSFSRPGLKSKFTTKSNFLFMNRLVFSLLIVLLACITIISCTDDSTTTTKLNVLLVDAPASYDEVNVEVLSVAINYGGENEEEGWSELPTESGIYNLLELTSGNEAILVSNEVPSGSISQIRLILGDNNSVVVDGEEYDLKTPSAQQSGVKLSINQEFEEGFDYTIVLDFDASRSIVANPVKYILKPVIRASMQALNGAIDGTIDPNEEGAKIYAIQDPDTITSTLPDSEGYFILRGMEEGTYTVSIDLPLTSEYSGQIIEDVSVNIGSITNLETIGLQEK